MGKQAVPCDDEASEPLDNPRQTEAGSGSLGHWSTMDEYS